jgi:hypothetical protein
LDGEQYRAAPGGHDRNEARELQRVAQPLLGVKQQALARRILSAPGRPFKTARLQILRPASPAPLVFLPALPGPLDPIFRAWRVRRNEI